MRALEQIHSLNPQHPSNNAMATPKKRSPKQPTRGTAIAAMLLCLAAAALTVVAQQPEVPAPAASAEAVAREILEIQKQLGGSIVPDLSRQQATPPRTSNSSETQIEHLRDTAWRLDCSAHRLECLDLYRHADALRELANRFRQDAREMKRQAAKSE
jgi:hypothetical protein